MKVYICLILALLLIGCTDINDEKAETHIENYTDVNKKEITEQKSYPITVELDWESNSQKNKYKSCNKEQNVFIS